MENLNENAIQNENDSAEEIRTARIPEGEVLCEVNYDVTLKEEEKAFKLFQKIYVRKSNIIKTVVFLLVFAVFFSQFITNKSDYISIIGMSIAVIGIFITWYNPVIIRKSLMKALAPLENDRYIFKLYKDAFSIETDMTSIEESELPEDEDGERVIPEPRIVFKDSGNFELRELDDIFVIIMKKETIYVLPKRCMDDKQCEAVRNGL